MYSITKRVGCCKPAELHKLRLRKGLSMCCFALFLAACGGGTSVDSSLNDGDSTVVAVDTTEDSSNSSSVNASTSPTSSVFSLQSFQFQNASDAMPVGNTAFTTMSTSATVDTLTESLRFIADQLLVPASSQQSSIFHEQGFLNSGNSFTVFKRRNPHLFNGSIQQTSVVLDSCENTLRDDTVFYNRDFGLTGQVCMVTVQYKRNWRSAFQSWNTKILFVNGVIDPSTVKIIGNRQPGNYVTGLNQLSIDTVDTTGSSVVAQESLDKINYVKARFAFTGGEGIVSWSVDGNKANSTHGIRGRGNTSWRDYPKKSYRVKFTQAYSPSGTRVTASEPRSPAGLTASRDWILLSQWREEDLMVTPVVQMAARLMGTSVVNSAVPVEVTWNGVYRGVYLLTEAIESGAGRVPVDTSKAPASGGDYIIELSTEYDQPGEQFRSTIFRETNGSGLPVMIKEAKSSTSAATLGTIESHFLQLEQALASMMRAPLKDKETAMTLVSNILDPYTAGQYLAATRVINNSELNHPKSVYLYYTKGKFHLGPLWDFDWTSYGDSLFVPQLEFFQTMYAHRDVKNNFCQALLQFRTNFSAFEDFVDDYANALRYGYLRDRALWPETQDRNFGWPPPTISRPSTIDVQLTLLKNSYINRTNTLLRSECSVQ